MKRAVLFKTLIDILYILLLLAIPGILFALPLGEVKINQLSVDSWSLFHWFLFAAAILLYFIFIRGLYFLRKMARYLLSNNYFSDKLICNLKKAGNHFLLSGTGFLVLIVIVWMVNLLYGIINDMAVRVEFDSNFLAPLFLVIVGMFFIMQGEALQLGKSIKEENDLTV